MTLYSIKKALKTIKKYIKNFSLTIDIKDGKARMDTIPRNSEILPATTGKKEKK